jgi:hypothetical protein
MCKFTGSKCVPLRPADVKCDDMVNVNACVLANAND